VNMEFFQIGPAVMRPRIQFIIHSHMWKLQPKLTNARGEEFLAKYCPQGVTPQEVIDAKSMSYPFSVRTVAKYLDIAIFKELLAGRGTESDGIFLDVTHVGEAELRRRSPITYERLKRAGADLAKEKIELGLVAQNFNGGILIDENGFTGVAGLYAAGEVSGGVHGSDRPGGNNLIDTQVFGCRAGRAAMEFVKSASGSAAADAPKLSGDAAGLPDSEVVRRRAALYQRELTIVRTAEGLAKVLGFADEQKPASHAERNALLVGKMIAQSAFARKESRGTHYREDFPHIAPEPIGRIVLRQGSDGEPAVTIAG